MLQELNSAVFFVGREDILINLNNTPALPIFSEEVVEFLSSLSDELLHNSEAKSFPDVAAYAFWIRRKSLEKSKAEYMGGALRVGRGVSFQITPSNIPVQFAVSMTYSLVAGNVSVIRLSSREFKQVGIICDAINKVIAEKCPQMGKYICILRYYHNDDIT
jgi:hypothetical protein